jgi:hypothetical protein
MAWKLVVVMSHANSLPDQSGIQFLQAELETGMTFAQVAESASQEEKKRRNIANARKAYDSVLRFLPDSKLSDDEFSEIKIKLEELRFALESLGENFES